MCDGDNQELMVYFKVPAVMVLCCVVGLLRVFMGCVGCNSATLFYWCAGGDCAGCYIQCCVRVDTFILRECSGLS